MNQRGGFAHFVAVLFIVMVVAVFAVGFSTDATSQLAALFKASSSTVPKIGSRVKLYGTSDGSYPVYVSIPPFQGAPGALGPHLGGDTGTVLGGPTVSNNFKWWRIDFDGGVDGWVNQDNDDLTLYKPPASPKIGARVQISGDFNTSRGVYSFIPDQTGDPSALGPHISGDTGTVLATRVVNQGNSWWKIDFDAGADGWINENVPILFIPPTSPKVGSRVKITGTSDTSRGVYADIPPAAFGSPSLGAHVGGDTGTVLAGPSVFNGLTWWKIDFDAGADGWINENVPILIL